LQVEGKETGTAWMPGKVAVRHDGSWNTFGAMRCGYCALRVLNRVKPVRVDSEQEYPLFCQLFHGPLGFASSAQPCISLDTLFSWQGIRERDETEPNLRLRACSVDQFSRSNFLYILNGIQAHPDGIEAA